MEKSEQRDQYVLYKISSLISDNEKYNRLEISEKYDVIDLFYNDAFYEEQFNLMTLYPSENRNEISELLLDIIKDDRFNYLDTINSKPEYMEAYVPFNSITKKILNNLESNDLSENNIMNILSPLLTVIKIGSVDIKDQKEKMYSSLIELEKNIDSSSKIKLKNETMNMVTKVIDEAIIKREEYFKSKEFDMIKKVINDEDYANSMPVEKIIEFKETLKTYDQYKMKRLINNANIEKTPQLRFMFENIKIEKTIKYR